MSILGGGGLAGYGGGLPGMGSSTQSGSSQSQQSTQIVPGMMGVYNQLLGLNQGNYQNVLNAYTQGQARQNAELPGIYQGYGTLGSQVNNTLGMGQVLGQNGNWGVASPAAQAIQRQYAQAQGDTTQSLANAGLGNTTAAQNFQNQNAYNAAQSYGNLGAQLAQTAAGYQAQIGQAGLGAQMQGSQAQAQLAAQRGSSLAGYDFKNTAGSLTGGFGSSSSQQTGSSQNRGGYPGGGSAQPQDFLQPQQTGGTEQGYRGGGGGGGGVVGGGIAGTNGYNQDGGGVGPVSYMNGGAGTAYDPNMSNGPGARPGGYVSGPNGQSFTGGIPDNQNMNAFANDQLPPGYQAPPMYNPATDYQDLSGKGGQGQKDPMEMSGQELQAKYGAVAISPTAGPPPSPNSKPVIGLRGNNNEKVIIGWQ